MKNRSKMLFLIAFVALVAGCAPQMQPSLAPPKDAVTSSASAKYISKVDNFQVILDSSLSMDEDGKNNFLVARELASRINQGIPTDLVYNGGLRSFGHNSYQSKNPTDLLYGMTNYRRSGFHAGLEKIKYTGGTSPLAAALDAAGNDLKAASGKSAVIVISDGLHMDTAPAAAKNLKTLLGDNVCIYTIAVSNKNNGAGHDLLQKVADAGQCGFATTAAALSDDAKLAAFIDAVFLAPKPAPKPVVVAPAPAPAPVPVPAPVVAAPLDSDGDGVTDDKDRCPDTPKGEMVDEVGCTLKLTLQINFDFDSAVIKPEFKVELDKAAAYIKKYAVPYNLVAGHTDSKGAEKYNQTLSERRAKAVRQYLIDNYGIAADALGVEAHGELQPVADNTTEAGRSKNRRVEIICCIIKPK